ncbi:hypothetical protein PANI_CDS0091 [Maribacter phage Panino]
MEHLQLLSKVLRYAGLNVSPQIISLILDVPTSTLIKNLDAQLKENPNPSLEEIDAIVAEIQAAEEAKQVAAAEEAKPSAKSKPVKKPKKTLDTK